MSKEKRIKFFVFIAILYIQTVNACTTDKKYECSCQNKRNVICANLKLSTIPDLVEEASVQTYDLRNNFIKEIRYGAFSNLNRLRTLYLNQNNLTDLTSGSFAGLRDLTDLYLYRNRIEKIDPNAFVYLVKLKSLYLQSNQIKHLEFNTFHALSNLERLSLANNKLLKLEEDLFNRNSNLKILRLDGNQLICDCSSMFWLWDYVNGVRQSRALEMTATCRAPAHLENKSIMNLRLEQFNCDVPALSLEPNFVQANELETVQMVCNVIAGDPWPKIEWFKNEQKIESNSKYSIEEKSSKLIIRNIEQSDEDEYKCVAMNRLGRAESSISHVKLVPKGTEIEYEIVKDDETFEEGEEDEPTNQLESIYNDNVFRFFQMPSDLTVNEGQYVKLKCRSNDHSNTMYKWLKNGVEIRGTNRFRINSDLEISDARIEDEAFYVCSIKSADQKNTVKYAQAYLTVNVPVTFLKRPEDLEATEGESTEFHCSVDGKPSPTIVWQKDMSLIGSFSNNSTLKQFHYEFYLNNQRLKINNLNRTTDSGVYKCIASNSVNTISTSAKLTIRQAIAPQFRIAQQNISVFEDHPITLECFAHGEPKPQVLWYRNGQRIATDTRVYFDSFGYLAISQVKVSDSGEYLCRAENIAGSRMHTFYFSVKDIYGTVITQTVIENALGSARNAITQQFQKSLNTLNDKRRPKTFTDLMALLRFPKDKTLDLVISEEIYERALDIVFRYANNITFNLTNNNEFITQEILTHRQLQQISDLSGCSRHKRKVNCQLRCLNYRTFDGTCNSLESPLRGAANTPLRRLVAADYQNGFSTPRGWNISQLYNGYMLPNARDISTHIITTERITSDDRYSLMLMQWGQFVDHDLGHTVMAMSLNRFSNGIACRDSCTNDQPCFPIQVMANDTLRTHLPGKCMEFVRSSAVCGTGETSLITNKIYQREQINQLTAFIDASNVYGSNEQDAFDIRERVLNNGKLKVHVTPKYPKGLPPFNLDTNMDCQRDNTTNVGCFMAGDYRANEQLGLLAMHNLWIRQHNRLADGLKKLNPQWTSEQIFQEARKIVGAQMQIITYDHWLPHVLGTNGMRKLGTYKGYNPQVDPTISNEFATAAFRFGHALIQPFTFRLNETFEPIKEGNLLLRDSFFAPQRYLLEGGMDPLLRGLFGKPAKLKTPKEIMNSELTERLFHIVRSVSQDLAALNIQRGRDHGLPGYAKYREYCQMSSVNSFEDLKNEISDKEVRNVLEKLYGDVRNIDIWPAGILEDAVPGSKLGPLFMCVIVNQMKTLRDGDRVFTANQLAELKKTSLAKIICENGDNIQTIQTDAFLNAKYPNEMTKCDRINDVSLEPWRNCCAENAKGLCGEPAYFYLPNEVINNK